MAFLNRPVPEDADLAAFADAVRATLVARPPASQVAAIVPRLAEEARIAHAQGTAGTRRTEPRSRGRLKTLGQLALGFCMVPLVAAGLAAAGVNLPEPAQKAFRSVGIDLPNQDEPAPEAPAAPATPAAPPAAGPGTGAGAKPDEAGPKPKKGKAKGKAKGNGHGQAQAPGQSGSAGSNGNGNGVAGANSNAGGNGKGSGSSGTRGNSSNAPGHNKANGSGGGSGNGNAVGKTGSTPPGQAGKPASPGNSADAPGKNK